MAGKGGKPADKAFCTLPATGLGKKIAVELSMGD
jgi:hypothetical protein